MSDPEQGDINHLTESELFNLKYKRERHLLMKLGFTKQQAIDIAIIIETQAFIIDS